jgi:uncharacterized protein
MRRKGFLLGWLLALLVAQAGWAGPASADFDAGVRAFERGDYAAALEAWTPLAEAGDADAQHNVGVLHEQGLGVAQDLAAAAQWYRRAAENGSPASAFNLANLYRGGQGVEADLERAAALYAAAAEAGHPESINNLGAMLLEGIGVERDEAQAAQLFALGAERGVVRSMRNLAFLYEEGRGVERNPMQAALLYRAAAERGDEAAAGRLAELGRDIRARFPEPGGQGELVRQLQALLNELGFDAGPVDGAMGPRTGGAIRAFEEAVGLPVTGEPSGELRRLLLAQFLG